MSYIVNWNDVVESSYIDVEGKYTLKIVEHETKDTANGNVCDVFTCQTKDGGKISVNMYRTEKSLWKYKKFLQALKVSTEGSCDLDAIAKSVVGKKFEGDVKRCPDKLNIVTGQPEPSKYFEVVKFYPVEG